MVVRKLRVSVPQDNNATPSLNIDSVDDPTMLAHRLIDTDSQRVKKEVTTRLRMSQMHCVCVRERLLTIRNSIIPEEFLPIGMRVTFDIGNAIHWFLQNSEGYLGKYRLGWWKCQACGHKIFGRKPSQNCHKCNALPSCITYHEHELHIPSGGPRVSGHIDCFFEVGPGDIRVVDFKTINGPDFDSMTGPKPEHCIQVNGYMHYIQQDDRIPVRINPDKGLLLYVSKKHERGLPFKMFHVSKDRMYLDVIENKVALFERGLKDSNYLPEPLQACVNSEFKSYNCRQCSAYSHCVEAYHRESRAK